MRFPSRKLADVKDSTGALKIPERHKKDRCLGRPGVEKGTLVGRIIGRALDPKGKPLQDTLRQEHYMEARFEVSAAAQKSLAMALGKAGEKPFAVPDTFSRAMIQPAFLGQLDVSPLGDVPGSQNKTREWKLTAQRVGTTNGKRVRVHLRGTSHVAGHESRVGRRMDGRIWEHEVTLKWEGSLVIDTRSQRITQFVAVARGTERLRWGRGKARTKPDVRKPAGRGARSI